MKKIFIVLLSIILCFVLCSCSSEAKVENNENTTMGENVESQSDNTTENNTTENPVTNSTTDKSKNPNYSSKTTTKIYVVEDETTTTKKSIDNSVGNEPDVDNVHINAGDLV